MFEAKKLIVFDFDGVLVESKQAVLAMFQKSFRKFGFDYSDAEMTALFGRPVHELVDQLLPKNLADRAKIKDEIIEYYNSLSSDREILEMVKLREGVRNTLSKLRKRGHKLAIITNQNRQALEAILKRMNLRIYFDRIIAADDGYSSKVEAGSFLIDYFKSSKEETVYVGDLRRDIIIAKKIGCASVAIPGWDDYETLKKAEPDYLLMSISEVW